jgi:hypothetical protein
MSCIIRTYIIVRRQPHMKPGLVEYVFDVSLNDVKQILRVVIEAKIWKEFVFEIILDYISRD